MTIWTRTKKRREIEDSHAYNLVAMDRAGFALDPGRRLSREEIAALVDAGKITPTNSRLCGPYVAAGSRFDGGSQHDKKCRNY